MSGSEARDWREFATGVGPRRKWKMMTRTLNLAVVLTALSLASLGGAGTENGEWRHYSGDLGATKYSPLDQISKENVARLRVAWRHGQVSEELRAANPQLRVSNNFRATPIMVDGVLYASNGVGLATAIDPESGRTLWTQKADEPILAGQALRGVAFWGRGADARVLTYRGRFLFALDPKTGEPIPSFGERGRIDLDRDLGPLGGTYRWNGAPLVVRDVVVMGSEMVSQDSAGKMEGEPGDVRAYDVRTGKLRWTFRVIPRPGEVGNETWENDSWSYTGAANVWSLMSADEELGYVYLPTSSATNDMFGGHRLGANLFSSSVVCVDVATGKRVWHFQTVHHDLFDYDNPAAPILADITVNGRRIRAIVQVTKQSWASSSIASRGRPSGPSTSQRSGPSPRAASALAPRTRGCSASACAASSGRRLRTDGWSTPHDGLPRPRGRDACSAASRSAPRASPSARRSSRPR